MPATISSSEHDKKADLATMDVVSVESPSEEKRSGLDHEGMPLSFGDAAHEVGFDLYQKADGLEWDANDEKRILRKIDLLVLPAFCITQGLAYLDKTALNYGKLFGMQTAIGATSAQFSWYASIFYIGYLVSAWPAGILMQKYPTGRVMGVLCFFWGIVCMCTAAVKSFPAGAVLRLMLGMLESGVTPGLGLMTPFWYKLDEVPLRHLTWYCFNGVAGIIGGLMSYGLGHVTGAKVQSWALIFLVLGAFTTIWGAYLIFFLADSPASARFLTEDQKIIAIKRVASSRTGTKNKDFKMEQVKEAFRDPKTYILFLASISAQIPNGVVSNFSSSVISSFGFTPLETTLLDIPGNIVQIVSLIVSGYLAGRFKNSRAIMMFIGNSLCILGAAVLTYAPKEDRWLRLVFFWFTSFQSVGFSLSLVMVSANVGGYTKRQTVTALTFIAYCIGNIAGPQTLISTEAAAGYPTATKAMMSCYVAKTFLHLCLAFYMWNQNRVLDKKAVERGEDLQDETRPAKAEALGMLDVTEWHNPYFRYAL